MRGDILFIHGWWVGGWIWSGVADQFAAAGLRTHIIDLPGPGTGSSGFDDHLSHAVRVARKIGNPILIGHSAGGLLAMKMCETLTPPACIAITPALPAGVVPRPDWLLLRFLATAMPSMLVGRSFFPRGLLPQLGIDRLSPMERETVLQRMEPISGAQVRSVLPGLVRVPPQHWSPRGSASARRRID
ncbi:alpha/beta hydrolase [Histidinibacterium aquaticum]|uniref:Alpha/beta hydrolase n=1 Tax=Histidinibacterium aquaticum TaxID=2613962 RepID=A0A5J5GB04_9RHOB|nr:alpha/beta hydrolase [Histidinibacterium aquaticum]